MTVNIKEKIAISISDIVSNGFVRILEEEDMSCFLQLKK